MKTNWQEEWTPALLGYDGARQIRHRDDIVFKSCSVVRPVLPARIIRPSH